MRKLALLTLSLAAFTTLATPTTAAAATYNNCNSSNNGYYVITEQKNSDSTCNIDLNELLSNVTQGNNFGGIYYLSNCFGTNIPGLDQWNPQIPETPETPETPEMPEVPVIPETPETPETPDIQVTPPAEKPEEDTQLPENQKPSTPETNRPGNDSTEDNKEDTTELSFAEQVVALVNEERAKAGLAPVTMNVTLTKAANVRSKEIVTSFSHTRPNGSSFSTAITQQGMNYRGAGENIAYGQFTPEQVMDGWMNSSGHRANILNKNYTTIGVGYYKSASGVGYWTQLFVY